MRRSTGYHPTTIALLAVTLAYGPTMVPDGFAQGAQDPKSAPVTVVNTTANPVPVTGALAVNGSVQQSGAWTVTAEETYAPGRAPKRYGPVNLTGPNDLVQIVPVVEAGKTFIVTHANAFLSSNNSAIGLASGACRVFVVTQTATGTNSSMFAVLPMTDGHGILTVNQEMFVPLKSGEGMSALCYGTPADGSTVAQAARVTIGGYFVPAS